MIVSLRVTRLDERMVRAVASALAFVPAEKRVEHLQDYAQDLANRILAALPREEAA